MKANIYYFLTILSFTENIFCTIKEDIEFEDKSNYNNADKRFKRVIEYTRWRIATRRTQEMFFKQEDDEIELAPTKSTDKQHELANVVIAASIPNPPEVLNIVDGTTKDYTRFVTPKNIETTEAAYLDISITSTIQDSEFTDIITSLPPTMKESAAELSTEIEEIVGVNQNAIINEAQTVEVPYPIEISHQVAPLAPFTSSQKPTESALKPNLNLGRKPFVSAQPPSNKPVRTNIVSDIFVPTRMYVTSITEDIGDFFSISPDQEKYLISSSRAPIESLHKTVQINFPHLTRSTYIDDLKTDVNKLSEQTEQEINITPEYNNEKDLIENNKHFVTRTTDYNTDSTYPEFNTESKNEITNTDSDYIEVKKSYTEKTELEQNTSYTMENEKEISPTIEADYTLSKENHYDKETEKEQSKDAPSRLDQFYDNIYMKYEVPPEPVLIPRKKNILDKTEYEEEENAEVSIKPPMQFTMASELDNIIDEPPAKVTPFTHFNSLSDPNIDVGDEEEESEEEEKSINKIKEKVAYIETTENLQNAFPFKTVNKTLTEQGQNDVYAPIEGVCSLVKLSPLNFKSARNLYEINIQLRMWSQNPMVKIVDITNGSLTYMENSINMVVIDDTNSQKNAYKVTIMIVAGIYGRDHIAVSSAMYFLYQLIEKSSTQKSILSRYRFLIIPVLNPDGYQYSTTFPKQRQWLKNLHQYYEDCNIKECESCFLLGTHCTLKTCYGVNLDRNFAYELISAEERAAENMCGMFYAGEKSLSELESQALVRYLKDETTKLSAFFSLKEGDVLGIMYPYSNTKNSKPFSGATKQNAFLAASAAYAVNRRPYVAGQMAEFLPLFSGGLEDWVDHHLGIENVYTIIMSRPSDYLNMTINVERIVHEAYAAFSSLLLRAPERSPPLVVHQKFHVRSNARTSEVLAESLILGLIFLWR